MTDRRSPALVETFGRALWLGQETGHNGTPGGQRGHFSAPNLSAFFLARDAPVRTIWKSAPNLEEIFGKMIFAFQIVTTSSCRFQF
jgi:hypothetical protein